MLRKLLALLLACAACMLLASAGLEPTLAAEGAVSDTETQENALPAEELIELVEPTEQADPQQDAQPQEDAPQDAPEQEQIPELPEEELDLCLLVDGKPVPKSTARTTIGGVTYVSLSAMSQALDPTARIYWDADKKTAWVATEGLDLSATVGSLYIEANGRYLYMQDGVQLIDGKTMVSLDAISKAFDAVNGWDAEAGKFTVTTGSGAIASGDDFYDSDSLFWLSRVIMAESGNQPLKGKMGVGMVVLNRVNNSRFPNTILGVLSQKNQFTTYRGGALANKRPNAQSVVAAKLVLDGGVVREIANALYFDGAPNSWAARHRPLITIIGGHRFYG